MKTKDHSKEYDINYIRSSQQNRYPLLFLDKIIEIKPCKYVKAIKNFTYNEWFFPAHFDALYNGNLRTLLLSLPIK